MSSAKPETIILTLDQAGHELWQALKTQGRWSDDNALLMAALQSLNKSLSSNSHNASRAETQHFFLQANNNPDDFE